MVIIKDVEKLKYSPYEIADILQRISQVTIKKVQIDYGTGELYSSTEVHLISHIADKPGITVTEIARNLERTKGAISQMLKKLEDRELIYRQRDPKDNKREAVFLTERGLELDQAHRAFDNYHTKQMLEEILLEFGIQDVDNAFTVLERWILIRERLLYGTDEVTEG